MRVLVGCSYRVRVYWIDCTCLQRDRFGDCAILWLGIARGLFTADTNILLCAR